jgi:stress responsive alpha/beta barrel protein
MFHHHGHLTLSPEATDAQVEAILDGLLALPGQVDGLQEARVARDAGLADGNASLRFHMVFDSEASWRAYGSHPAHVAVVTDHIKPVLAGKAMVQHDDADVRVATA